MSAKGILRVWAETGVMLCHGAGQAVADTEALDHLGTTWTVEELFLLLLEALKKEGE